MGTVFHSGLTTGEKIDDLLKENNLTLTSAADMIGISQSSLSDIINDKRAIRSDTLLKICDFFNVSSDFLLGLSDVRFPDADDRAICDHFGMTGDAYEGLRRLYMCGEYEHSFVFHTPDNMVFAVNTLLSAFGALPDKIAYLNCDPPDLDGLDSNSFARVFSEALFDLADYYLSKSNSYDLSVEAMGRKYRLVEVFQHYLLDNFAYILRSNYTLLKYDFGSFIGEKRGNSYMEVPLHVATVPDPNILFRLRFTKEQLDEADAAIKEELEKQYTYQKTLPYWKDREITDFEKQINKEQLWIEYKEKHFIPKETDNAEENK